MFKLLKCLSLKEKLMLILSLILVVVATYFELQIPGYMQDITKGLQSNASIGKILSYGGMMLAVTLIAGGLSVLIRFINSKLSANLGAKVRKDVFSKVNSLDSEDVKSFSTASLMTRTTNDVQQVQSMISMGLQPLVRGPAMAIGALAIIINSSWEWTLATGIAVAVLLVLLSIMVLLVLPKFKVIQKLTDNVNKVSREGLTGARVIKAYNAETFQGGKFEKVNDDLTKTNLFTGRTMGVLSPGMTLIMNTLNLAIYVIGAYLIFNITNPLLAGDLFAEMITFSSYAMQVVISFILITVSFVMLPRAITSARRINEVLDKDNKILSGENEFTDDDLEIEFKNVGFRYADAEEHVLKNINFTAKKGQTIAIVGGTGSGKSTLLSLIPRFYDITDGELLFNGKPINSYDIISLRNQMGYVPQKAVLFSGSVEYNMNFGDAINEEETTEEELMKSLDIADAKSFVENLEKGTESFVAQGGNNFSGGQKQRLSIARAINRRPKILLLDDSFSALDYKTDKSVRSKINKNLKNTIKIIVAQRVSTIKDADKIVVLHDGVMVGCAKHNTLMKSCKEYQEIALSQLSKEELAK